MADLTPLEILYQADKLRNTSVGMTNYKTVLNNAFVLMREMARHIKELSIKVDTLEKQPKSVRKPRRG